MSQAPPSKTDQLEDKPVEAAISAPELLGKGFRTYLRFHYTLPGEDPAHPHTHDLIRFGRIVAVLPVDLARDEVVLIRQFRLPAQVANGRGDMVEIVAGHVEAGEQLADAAHRECVEEIGVAPRALAELFTYLPTPGASDERITLFLGIVDSAQVPDRAGSAAEREETHPFRVPIDAALAALADGAMYNGLLVLALHWLALNRGRLAEVAKGGVA
ncbi:MAG TPA: NUDIX hydrolase [Xanthobacteraceae bacterium]|nr:NUDIX hydrolase [Xanthobacteraceae bacterium]